MRLDNLVRSVLIIFSAVVLFLEYVTAQATCYQCDNYSELNRQMREKTHCTEKVNKDLMTSSTDCPEKEFNGCIKSVTESWRSHVTGVPKRIAIVVTRDCARIPEGLGVGCHRFWGAGTTKTTCYCRGDNCNSAPKVHHHLSILSLTVLGAFVTLTSRIFTRL